MTSRYTGPKQFSPHIGTNEESANRIPVTAQHAASGRQLRQAQQLERLTAMTPQGGQGQVQNSPRMAAQRRAIDRFAESASTSLMPDAETKATHNAQMPIQRVIAIPPFNGPHPVASLFGLPATTMNYTTRASGDFTVPATNTARLGAYKGGTGAVNTNLSFALQGINQQRGDIYERCHLIANALGGEGRSENIVPGTKAFNASARDDIEMPIIAARGGANKRLFAYTVSANYGVHANPNLKPVEKLLPTSFGYSLWEYHWTGAGSSTDIGNWVVQPPINLGGDAVKQNDLSALAVLNSDLMGASEPKGGLDGITQHFAAQIMGAINKTELFMEANDYIKNLVRETALQGINSDRGKNALPRNVISEVVDYMHGKVPEVATQVMGFIDFELNARVSRVVAESLQLMQDARQSITQKLTYSMTGEDQHVDRIGVEATMKRIEEKRKSLLERCRHLIENYATLAKLPDPLDLLNDFAADVFEETSRASLYT